MIAIIDYGMGNLRSVQKGFERVGAHAEIVDDPDAIRTAERLVLPGVGAFGDAMKGLSSRHLVEPIKDFVDSGRPFLGICLGLQLLFERGFEGEEQAGLGIVPGDVIRFSESLPEKLKLKVPHMGWNQIQIRKSTPHLEGLPEGSYVYFVHSYYVVPSDNRVVCTETDYGGNFVSSVAADNVFATQFHPEKSQQVGLRILRNFAAL